MKSLAMGAAACAAGREIASPALAGVTAKLPRSSPESLGIDPGAVLAFVDAVEKNPGGMHSFMLLRHGKVAAEGWWHPYAPQYSHMLYSLSKSFTSTAVGLAVTDGELTVDAPVISFFPEEAPSSPSANLAAMRVRHLLTMNTGHDKDATGATTGGAGGNWVKNFLSLTVEHEPGSKFVYNSAATYMLSAIAQKLTGKTVLDYLTPRLFSPLGIEGMTWETCPRGINTGGWGLSVKTEDIARFGQLYLQKGKWNGRELVPEKWINEATTKQVSNGDPATGGDWNQGYGYQFWRCRHGFFRGDGAFGQFCIVMPQHDAVLAITSGVGDMGAVMQAAWDNLLPGFDRGPSPVELKKRLAGLEMRSPAGSPTSSTSVKVNGKSYKLIENSEKIETASFKFDGDHCTITLRDADGEHSLRCGHKDWTKGMAPYGAKPIRKVAAKGAWTSDDTYTMALCYYETPYVDTVDCRFGDNRVAIARGANVGFGPTERPVLVGKSA